MGASVIYGSPEQEIKFVGFLVGFFFFKQKRADQDIVMRLFQGPLAGGGGREAGAEELVVFK